MQGWEPQVRVREQEATHGRGCWDGAGLGWPNRFSPARKGQVRSGSARGTGWGRGADSGPGKSVTAKDSCCLGVFRKLAAKGSLMGCFCTYSEAGRENGGIFFTISCRRG